MGAVSGNDTYQIGHDLVSGTGTGFVDLAQAVAAWRQKLGEDAVIVHDGRKHYESNCIGLSRKVPVALKPQSEAQVQEIVRIARACRVPIYPISTGRNWGYGAAAPAHDRCVVVDLSAMRSITEFDAELGLVTVQPGVTQGQLCEFLERGGHQFMVPVTGAGPTCSILGNALERGYGITPHTDHFAAVRSIRAVLPDGDIYRSAIAEAGGATVDKGYKWGVGPYLDGLYSQGGFGVVTAMTIALAPRPDKVEAFLIDLNSESQLEPVVDAVRDLVQKNGGSIGGINLMNRLRLLSMFHPYPADKVREGAIPSDLVDQLGDRSGLPRWMGLGAIYGDREVVPGLRRAIRRRLKPHSDRIRFVSQSQISLARSIAKFAPQRLAGPVLRQTNMAGELLDILSGRPRETALRLAYWKSGKSPKANAPMDPARDGCGLLWFAPLVPIKADAVRDYVSLVNETCPKFGIDPLVTLTTVSEQCFDSTVPILFDRDRDGEKAHECYHALFDACRSRGYLPYRMNVESMRLYTDDSDSSYWQMVKTLKSAIDPHNLIAPGRYAPAPALAPPDRTFEP